MSEKELEFLKTTFSDNGYPLEVIQSIVRAVELYVKSSDFRDKESLSESFVNRRPIELVRDSHTEIRATWLSQC